MTFKERLEITLMLLFGILVVGASLGLLFAVAAIVFGEVYS